MDRKFSSFEEIDTQLEILRIQRQLSLGRLGENLRQAPGNILREGWTHTLRPALTGMVLDWALYRLRGLRKKLRPELPEAF